MLRDFLGTGDLGFSKFREELSAVANAGRVIEKSVDSTRPPPAKGNRWVDPPPDMNSSTRAAFVWITDSCFTGLFRLDPITTH